MLLFIPGPLTDGIESPMIHFCQRVTVSIACRSSVAAWLRNPMGAAIATIETLETMAELCLLRGAVLVHHN